MFHKSVQFVRDLASSVIHHNTGVLAAVIAYFGFSSMIPLVLLIVFAASHVVPQVFVNHFLSDFVESYIPTLPDSRDIVLQNVTRLEDLGGRISVFGILGLLWTTIGGFVSFQYILDLIWGIHQRRPFIRQYIVGLGTLVFLMALTAASAIVTAITPKALHFLGHRILIAEWLAVIHITARVSFPIFLLLTCYFCFRFLPSRALPQGLLWLGAALATAAIYVSHLGFMWYTGHLGRYQIIYGTLTFIMLLLFWVYIVSMIVLLAGEVIVVLHRQRNPQ